ESNAIASLAFSTSSRNRSSLSSRRRPVLFRSWDRGRAAGLRRGRLVSSAPFLRFMLRSFTCPALLQHFGHTPSTTRTTFWNGPELSPLVTSCTVLELPGLNHGTWIEDGKTKDSIRRDK